MIVLTEEYARILEQLPLDILIKNTNLDAKRRSAFMKGLYYGL
jgi:hypothetical protein